ncbi:MAG: hypothetical protein ACI4X9_05435 [Kiritimatiellia bacterium]
MSASVPSLLVIGLGGCGCRLAQETLRRQPGLPGLLLDTAAGDLPDPPAPSVLFGAKRLNGKGTGGQSSLGRDAFRDDLEECIRGRIPAETRLAVILTGLGGGTGSGAAPELVKALRARGVATVCLATLPLGFEPESRRKTADAIVSVLEGCSDALIRIPLDDLLAGKGDWTLEEALGFVFGRVAEVAACFWKILTMPGFLALDEPRLLQFLRTKGGGATLRVKSVSGPGRLDELEAWLNGDAQLGAAFGRAHSVLLGLVAGADLRLAEVGRTVEAVRRLKQSSAAMEFGTVLDVSAEGALSVVLLLFESWSSAATQAQEAGGGDLRAEEPGKRGGRRRGGASRGASGAGRFRDVEPTFDGSVNLDVPAFRRRNCTLDY